MLGAEANLADDDVEAHEPKVCAYIACSVDGFIAGPNDDLSWLPQADANAQSESGAIGFETFMKDVGALLMGRRTYDVVARFEGPWPHGDRPVLVASHRPVDSVVATVRAVEGSIVEMVGEARELALRKNVYVDGGTLIRQTLDAGLLDEVIVTIVPVVLGRGHPLFAGATKRHPLEVLEHHRFGGEMIQLVMRVVKET